MLLISSCKKNNEGNNGSITAPTLTIHAGFVPQKVKTGPIKIGEHVTNSGKGTNLAIAYDFVIGGTLNKTYLRNYYVVVREKNDTTNIIYQSNLSSATPPTFRMNTFITNMNPRTEYLVSQYATVQSGASGTIETSVSMEYEAEEFSNWVRTVPGQTIIASPYKSTVSVTAHPMTTMVTNGTRVEQETLLDVSSGDTVGLKQIAWRMEYADHGLLDTLQANDLQIELNGQVVTAEGMFVDSLGNRVDSLKSIIAAHRKIYFVFSAGPGQKKLSGHNSLKLTFVVDGLGPNAEGDAVRAMPIKDDALPPSGWSFLNQGTIGAYIKLFSGPVANSAAKPYHFLWTDLTLLANTGIIGFSSGDWYNSYHLVWNVAPSIFHSRSSR